MRTANLLLAAATLFSGFCLGGQAAKAVLPRAADPAVLHPINLRSYEAAMGLQRRDGEDFTDLDPDTQSQLIYGRPGGKRDSPAQGLDEHAEMKLHRTGSTSPSQHDPLRACRAANCSHGAVRGPHLGSRLQRR